MIDLKQALKDAFNAAFTANAGGIQQCVNCYTVQFFNAVKAAIPADATDKIAASYKGGVDGAVTRLIEWELFGR